MSGLLPMGFPASPSPSRPILAWQNLNKPKCWKWKAGPRNGVYAFFVTKRAMRSKMPTNSAGAKRVHFRQVSQRYPMYYSPRPYSRSFVRHLDLWYAQAIRTRLAKRLPCG